MNIRLDVKLQAAGFTPTSEFRADLIISLNQHKEKQQLWRNQHKVIRKQSPVPSQETSPHHVSDRNDDRKLAYIVCQLAGRWVAERNWIVPFVYDSLDDRCLSHDNDDHLDVGSSNGDTHPSSSNYCEPTGNSSRDLRSLEKAGLDIPAVYKAALEDALHWGSSGVEGYSGFIFRYSPQVILTNQNINAEHSLVIHLSCRLPDYIPPTFRGTSIKYQYLLAIVAADASRLYKPQVLRIPLALTTSQATSVVRPIYIPWTSRPDFKEQFKPKSCSFRVHTRIIPNRDNIQRMIVLSPNGRITPFDKRDEDPRQFAVSFPVSEETIFDCNEEDRSIDGGGQVVQDDIQGPHTFPYFSQKDIYSTDDNVQSVYQIKQDTDIVCRIYIWKRVFRCGDSIVGFVEFSQSKIPCYRMTIKLETEERVHPKACNRFSKMPLIFRKSYGERMEYPSFEQNTEFIFTLPLDAPVSFETSAVSFLWLLRFVFEIPDGPVDLQDTKYHKLLSIPLSEVDYLLQRNTKLLNWCLPLVVYGGDRLAFVPDTVVSLDLSYDK
ncbi:hypothetical protein GpartN1_g2370.t1 [Galdieria partita]|uniref:Uncharacterized protein n=1 Tax=Galdieria partita TaxID=83374 RepID=A0A9C7PUQ3_9RHOD|nr:hypothetical protein GpartN1_g2370.t1 [Galdieria partita]